MSCPHLKEVVMLFCDAYPVKKMLPLDRIASAHPCLGRDFDRCPLYCELVERLARECDGCRHRQAAGAACPLGRCAMLLALLLTPLTAILLGLCAIERRSRSIAAH